MRTHTDQVAAVILAGGLGTRIRHLLPDRPKPMALVSGRPFLEWVVRFLAVQGIRRVILSTGFRSEVVEQYFASHPIERVSIQCVCEPEPLGTAGGFAYAVAQSGRSAAAWLVLNGDSLALGSLQSLIEAVLDQNAAAGILGVSMPDASRYGSISMNQSGELVRFDEKKPGAGLINAGVYLFSSRTVAEFPRKSPLSFEKDVFPMLLSQNARIRVCTVDAPFLDIGTPESLPQAEEFISRNQHWFLEHGDK